ncbi:MAG: phenylacetate--CoA ligase family protein [Bacteroidales bacterium]
MTYYQPELETISADDLKRMQLHKLKKTIRSVSATPFYKNRFSQKGIDAENFKTLDQLSELPFTTKNDLRDFYPFGMAAVPMNDVVRLHSSSGTTGTPTVVLHTQTDLDLWALQVARCLYMIGLRKNDVFQNTSGYGMFTGGLGFQYGAERLGALTVPAAAGNSKRQVKFIIDFGTTAIHAIPSYITRLADVLKAEGYGSDGLKTKLKQVVIGAEPHTEEQRRRIEELLGVKAYNCYGMSEMCGPGVAFECEEQNGMHLWEDYYLAEILDPVTLRPIAEGEIGELVLTTLNREAMPLIRYRTRDLTRFLPGACPCGRTHRRIDRIQGRSDDMIILKGVNIFPMQIESVLMRYPELANNYLITLVRNANNDEMIVEVELVELYSEDYNVLKGLSDKITRGLKDELLITPQVKLVQKGTLPANEGKAQRVRDLRF